MPALARQVATRRLAAVRANRYERVVLVFIEEVEVYSEVDVVVAHAPSCAGRVPGRQDGRRGLAATDGQLALFGFRDARAEFFLERVRRGAQGLPVVLGARRADV